MELLCPRTVRGETLGSPRSRVGADRGESARAVRGRERVPRDVHVQRSKGSEERAGSFRLAPYYVRIVNVRLLSERIRKVRNLPGSIFIRPYYIYCHFTAVVDLVHLYTPKGHGDGPNKGKTNRYTLTSTMTNRKLIVQSCGKYEYF